MAIVVGINPKLEICQHCPDYRCEGGSGNLVIHVCRTQWREFEMKGDTAGCVLRSEFAKTRYGRTTIGKFVKAKHSPWNEYRCGDFGIPKGCHFELEQILSNQEGGFVSSNVVEHTKLVEEANKAHTAGQKERALDIVFETIDTMCHDGKFKEINDVLKITEVSKCSLCVSIGLLAITFAANEHLPDREDFFQRVKAHAISIGEYKKNLLTGLSTKEDFWN